MSQISERLVSVKRHTTGYSAGGVDYTRAQAIKAVRAGTISGVRIANGPKGPYLTSSVEGQSLYSLPSRVVSSLRNGKAVTVAAKKATARPAKKAAKTAAKKTRRKA